ncbi:MAG: ABC transporter permease subunit [Roseiflexaceae bacterium]|nr:ABC transporter permease subunit [Roseiflexaceae bacterium]
MGRTRLKPGVVTWLLLAPCLIVLCSLFLGGLLFGLAQSLGLWSVVDVGGPTLAFYGALLGNADITQSLGLTLYVAAVSTLLASVASLALALLLRQTFRGTRALRLLVQLPLPVPHLVAAIGIALLLTQSGVLARLFHAAGLIAAPEQFPTLIYDRAAVGIILTYVWKELPFMTLVTLAALRASGEEAERIARNLGARPSQVLWHITLPLIAPALLGAATIVFAFTFGAFEVPLLLGQSYPRLLAVEAYARYQDTDLAVRPAALALNTLIALCTALAVPPYIWLLRRSGWMAQDPTTETRPLPSAG